MGKLASQYPEDKKTVRRVKTVLRENRLSGPDIRKVVNLVRNVISLNNRIERLQPMQKLFRYWHVAHLPFALIMLIIMVIHVGIIKNSVEQGEAAVQSIVKSGYKRDSSLYDLIIIGAGPAGISTSLTAKKHGLNFLTLEQDSPGGTVFNFPRSKIVMTAPMDLPLHGKTRLFNTSKTELPELWQSVMQKNDIRVRENTKVEGIQIVGDAFPVVTLQGEVFKTKNVLLAIGRRGSPRKLGVAGETLEKVTCRLLEPENVLDKRSSWWAAGIPPLKRRCRWPGRTRWCSVTGAKPSAG